MEENIRFAYTTRDGRRHEINVAGVQTIFDAADEVRQSIVNGDVDIKLGDVISIEDVEG